jgi:phosphatidylglycerophosphatase A
VTLVRLIASGCGTGYAPIAPGTVASMAAALLGWGLLGVSAWLLVLAALAATAAGFWALAREPVTDDPGWVVIDEFAGQWIALIPATDPVSALAGFALFRLFDITKPGPVGWADRQHGSFGLMADDLIAGALAAAILFGIQLALGPIIPLG